VEGAQVGGGVELLSTESTCALARQAVAEAAQGGIKPTVHVVAGVAAVYARAGLRSDARLLLRILLAPVSGEDYTQATLHHDLGADERRLREALQGSRVPSSRGGQFLLEHVASSDASLHTLGLNTLGHAFGAPSGAGNRWPDTSAFGVAASLLAGSSASSASMAESFPTLEIDASSFASVVLALGAAGLPDAIAQLIDHAAELTPCPLDLVAALSTYAALVEAGDVDAAEALLSDARFDLRSVAMASHGSLELDAAACVSRAFELVWSGGRAMALDEQACLAKARFARGLVFSVRETAIRTLHTLRIMALATAGRAHAAFRLLEHHLVSSEGASPSASEDDGFGSLAPPSSPTLSSFDPEAVTAALRALSRLSSSQLVAKPAEDAPLSATVLPYVHAADLLRAESGKVPAVGAGGRLDRGPSISAKWTTDSIVTRLERAAHRLRALGWGPTASDLCALIRIYAIARRPLTSLLLGWKVLQRGLSGLKGPSSSSSSRAGSARSRDIEDVVRALTENLTEFEQSETGASSSAATDAWIGRGVWAGFPSASSLSGAGASPQRVRHLDPGSGLALTNSGGATGGRTSDRQLTTCPDLFAALLWAYAVAPKAVYDAGLVTADALGVLRATAGRSGVGLGGTAEALLSHAYSRIRVAGSAASAVGGASSELLALENGGASGAATELEADFLLDASSGADAYDVRPCGTSEGSLASFLTRRLVSAWLPCPASALGTRFPTVQADAYVALRAAQLPSLPPGGPQPVRAVAASLPPPRALVSLLASVGYAGMHVLRQPQGAVQYAHALAAGVCGRPVPAEPGNPDAFVAAAGLPTFRVTGKAPAASSAAALAAAPAGFGMSLSLVSSSPSRSHLGRSTTSRSAWGALAASSSAAPSGTSGASVLDADTARVEAEILVLQMELEELAAASAAAEEELAAKAAAVEVEPAMSAPEAFTAPARPAGDRAQQQHIQRLRQQASVLRTALGLLETEEGDLGYRAGLDPRARTLLAGHQMAAKRTTQESAAAHASLSSTLDRIAALETDVLHALSGAVSAKRLPAAVVAVVELVGAQTERLAYQDKARAMEADAVRANQQEASLAAAEAFARQRGRGNERMVEVVETLTKQIEAATADLAALHAREAQLRDWSAALNDMLHQRGNEGETGSVQPFVAATQAVEQARMQLESAKARHAIDRRLAVAGRMEEAVADVRAAGEKNLADTRAKYAKDAEAWTLEYRRKCEAAQDKLRAALEGELAPVAAVAEAEARAASDRKAAVLRELTTCEEALTLMTRENASLGHFISDTVSATNDLRTDLRAPPVAAPSTTDDIRAHVAAAIAEHGGNEPDLLLRILEDLERMAEADPLRLLASPRTVAGGTLPASALADLVSVYEDECRRKRVTAGAPPAQQSEADALAAASDAPRGGEQAAWALAGAPAASALRTPTAAPFPVPAGAASAANVRDRGRSSAATAVSAGPAGAKHAFTLLQTPMIAAAAAAAGGSAAVPPAAEEAARRAEAEADAARVRERVLKRLASKEQPAAQMPS
jgi:hypothetical protein